MLSDARDLVAKNHSKGLQFDEVEKRAQRAENELRVTLAKLREVETIAASASEREKELRVRFETTSQRESLLREDKEYLRRVNDEINERKNQIETQNAELMARNIQLSAAREEILEKYIKGTDSARAEAQKERQSQIESLKSETDSELSRIKQNLHELYGRETAALRESRDAVLSERDNLRIENDRAKEQLRAIEHELVALRSSGQSQRAESDSNLAHAQLEARRAGMAREELQSALDAAQRDAKAARSKADLLQREIYQVQNQNQKKLLEVEGTVRTNFNRIIFTGGS